MNPEHSYFQDTNARDTNAQDTNVKDEYEYELRFLISQIVSNNVTNFFIVFLHTNTIFPFY